MTRPVDAADVAFAVAAMPAGVFLTRRLTPAWGVEAAIGSLLLPVGTLWTIAGVMTVTGLADTVPDARLMVIGSALVGLSVIALTARRVGDTSSDLRRPIDLTLLHLATRILGVAFVVLAVALPIVAQAYPEGGLVPAPLSLGLLPAGVFLATRPFPRRALGTITATLAVPIGSIWFMLGALTIEDRELEPQVAAMTAGSVILVIAAIAAWSTWGSGKRGLRQVALRAVAIVVWVIVGTASAQALVEPQSVYIDPLSLALDGSTLVAELPNIGPCGTSLLELDTRVVDQVLQVSLSWINDGKEYVCISSCLAGDQILCTNFVRFTLDPAPPPGLKPVAAGAPLTGLLRAPFRWLLFGALLGGAIWRAGNAAFAGRREKELTGSAP